MGKGGSFGLRPEQSSTGRWHFDDVEKLGKSRSGAGNQEMSIGRVAYLSLVLSEEALKPHSVAYLGQVTGTSV